MLRDRTNEVRPLGRGNGVRNFSPGAAGRLIAELGHFFTLDTCVGENDRGSFSAIKNLSGDADRGAEDCRFLLESDSALETLDTFEWARTG